MDKQPLAKRKRNNLYRSLGRAFLRVPILPIETLCASLADAVQMAEESSLLSEATLIASPSLREALSRRQIMAPRKMRQLQSSLMKYVIRASTRTTPFGLFSGIAPVSLGDETAIALAPPSGHRHRTRMDMEWLLGYIHGLESIPGIQAQLMYTHQPIMVRIGDRYHFDFRNAEGRITDTSVVATTGFELLLDKTRNGKRYADLLAEMLAEVPEATATELSAFIKKFIDYGIICSSLRPPLTCADPARYVLEQLEALPEAKNEARQLRSLLDALRDYDAYGPGEGGAKLQAISDEALKVHARPGKQVPFTIDLAIRFMGEPGLKQSIADDAAQLAETLLKISQRNPDKGALSDYRQNFIGRYGRFRLVPLLELIHPDIGLGVPGYYMDAAQSGGKVRAANLSEYDNILLGIATEALCNKQFDVQLDEQTIERLINPRLSDTTFPHSLDMVVQIAAQSQEQVNRNEYLLVASPLAGVQMAGRTIGRFADLLGSDTVDYLQNIADLQAAQRPGYINAELVYMPYSGHAANVAVRPLLRPYEIALGTNPGVATTHALHLNDLYIGVHSDRFYVWSESQQKPVTIWYGHMLNTVSAPSVCRLLVDISLDGEYPLSSFSWGAAASLPVLPRLTYSRLVLSLAEWKLDVREVLGHTYKARKADRSEASVWHKKLRLWRKKWRVPQHVYLTQRDNRLLLDLDREDQAMELLYAATAYGKMHRLRLQEALPGPGDAWISGKGGHYLNECIFQLVRKTGDESTTYSPPRYLVVRPKHALQRAYVPGDTWIFCKLYIPSSQQDEYLTGYIYQLVCFISDKQAAEAWFFIRYADPEFHIRLRFRVSSTAQTHALTSILMSWAKKMQAAGLLQRFCIDQYDREVERYGGEEAIATAEAIFAVDSGACLRLINAQQSSEPSNVTLLQVTVLTTSILLTAFGLDNWQQAAWAKARHNLHAYFIRDYRKDRQHLLPFLLQYREGKATNSQVSEVCRTFEQQLRPLGYRYSQLEKTGQLELPLENILESFLHMHINRLVGMDRVQEQRLLTYIYRALADMPHWSASEKRKQNP